MCVCVCQWGGDNLGFSVFSTFSWVFSMLTSGKLYPLMPLLSCCQHLVITILFSHFFCIWDANSPLAVVLVRFLEGGRDKCVGSICHLKQKCLLSYINAVFSPDACIYSLSSVSHTFPSLCLVNMYLQIWESSQSLNINIQNRNLIFQLLSPYKLSRAGLTHFILMTTLDPK